MFDTQLVQAKDPVATLVLAHGAGAGKEHDFMQSLARELADNNINVVLFNFPYMQQIKETGKRRPPDKMPVLEAHFCQLVAAQLTQSSVPVFIGGKSMGGRVSTMILAQTGARGAIAYGYPFHPPGKPDKLRLAHLLESTDAMQIIQGERDTFGTQTEVEGYALPAFINVAFLSDGDHSFKPRKASGLTQEQHIRQAAVLTRAFINQELSL